MVGQTRALGPLAGGPDPGPRRAEREGGQGPCLLCTRRYRLLSGAAPPPFGPHQSWGRRGPLQPLSGLEDLLPLSHNCYQSVVPFLLGSVQCHLPQEASLDHPYAPVTRTPLSTDDSVLHHSLTTHTLGPCRFSGIFITHSQGPPGSPAQGCRHLLAPCQVRCRVSGGEHRTASGPGPVTAILLGPL